MNLLTEELIQSLHDSILFFSSGLRGNAAGKNLGAIVSRVEMAIFYSGQKLDVFDVAAMYCVAINKGHVFNDGNKRTSMIAMEHFLGFNDYYLCASDMSIADKMVDVASEKINQSELSDWLRTNCQKIEPA